MTTYKKQLLIIGKQDRLLNQLSENLSIDFEITIANSIHTGYNIALQLLPDIIVIDHSSFSNISFKNLKNFKSTHFLNKAILFLLVSSELEDKDVESLYNGIPDEILCTKNGIEKVCKKIIQKTLSDSSITNYWKDSFMGLFNLMSNPVILLHNEDIVAMNDAFKDTFRLHKKTDLKLTDFVHCDNKLKAKMALRNFARGKHMKASTTTSLLLKNNKTRNAKINFSKLDKMISGQYIMMINFDEEDKVFDETVGSTSSVVNDSFEDTTSSPYSFTKREKEIIELLIKGYKTKDISSALFISAKTIEKHRSNIIKRTNSETILESIIYAINHKLIEVHI